METKGFFITSKLACVVMYFTLLTLHIIRSYIINCDYISFLYYHLKGDKYYSVHNKYDLVFLHINFAFAHLYHSHLGLQLKLIFKKKPMNKIVCLMTFRLFPNGFHISAVIFK